MAKHMTISDLPEKYQRAAYAQLGAGKPLGLARAEAVGKFAVEVVPTPHDGPAHASPIRQRTKGDSMNRWERQFLTKLTEDYPVASIHREVSLPLANGLRYKLDFLVGWIRLPKPIGYEVKGQKRAAGIAKLKMAANLYPWITFYLVTKDKATGEWLFDQVHP